jgi:long-chain fatty acid transport protein
MKRTSLVLAWVVIFGLIANPATSGPNRMFGYDSWSVGTSNSQHAWGAGTGALYTNPALLIDLEDQFGVSFMMVQPSVRANLMGRPANADIPITFYDSDVGIEGSNLDRPLPTLELPNPRADSVHNDFSGYIGIGLVHSLGIEDFRIGLSVLAPTSGLASISSNFPDEREQYFSNTVHFTRFGEWSEVLSFLFGAAYRPLKWFSFGASVEGKLYATAVLNAYVPEATVQDYALANLEMDASPGIRAVVGFNFRPLEWLSLSAVWRDRRFSKVDTDALLNLWNYHETGDTTVPKRVKQNHLLALDFEPQEVTLAAGVQLNGFTAEIGVTWNHWADYLDTHHQRAQETAEFEPTNPTDQPVDGESFAFSDTWSFSAGGSWTYLEGFTATAGLAYRPTPVPPQVGRTSYVDNDVLCASIGHRFDFTLAEQNLRVDVGFQFAHLFASTVHKDPALIRDEFADRARTLIGGQPMSEAAGLQTNNPGFPGYDFEGWTLLGAISLSYLF